MQSIFHEPAPIDHDRRQRLADGLKPFQPVGHHRIDKGQKQKGSGPDQGSWDRLVASRQGRRYDLGYHQKRDDLERRHRAKLTLAKEPKPRCQSDEYDRDPHDQIQTVAFLRLENADSSEENHASEKRTAESGCLSLSEFV